MHMETGLAWLTKPNLKSHSFVSLMAITLQLID